MSGADDGACFSLSIAWCTCCDATGLQHSSLAYAAALYMFRNAGGAKLNVSVVTAVTTFSLDRETVHCFDGFMNVNAGGKRTVSST